MTLSRPELLPVSVAIVAKNEAANLARILPSISWAEEIILIDSGSVDDTVEIARAHGARIFHEPWRGYGPQVNSALDKCTCPWILNLDADEEVSPALAHEIRALLSGNPKFNAYMVPRLNCIFGRWMRHGGLYPDHKLRLFRNRSARLREDTEPHATPKTTEPVGMLKGDILHYQYPTSAIHMDHMRTYSSASVPLLLRRGKTSKSLLAFWWNTLVRPATGFFYNYVLRGGFLDGKEGLLFHRNHAIYVKWKYEKARNAAKLQASGSPSLEDPPASHTPSLQ